ncbi:MAG: ribonuclease PH [Christensenellales bacterium]|jgi:ribonuclease PH
MIRSDGRSTSQHRDIRITRGFISSAPGSVLFEAGKTRVLCCATISEKVPPFLAGTGRGWLTAEYAMLPASTGSRKPRELLTRDGRSVEIQRLIGRSLRAAIDLTKIGERTINIDCDVIEADGGTRTASISGGYIALELLLKDMLERKVLLDMPLKGRMAAISAGILDGEPVVDFCYTEDARADADMNIVMLEDKFVDIQCTGEKAAFTFEQTARVMEMAASAIQSIYRVIGE